MYYTEFDSEFGQIILIGDENGLFKLSIKTKENKINLDEFEKNDEFFKSIKKQLIEYFNKERKTFDIKLNLKGSEFQKKVWNELLNIPYGTVCTYKDIAIKIGNEKASRAVGMANNKNNIPIIIPCHRVIGSNKKLVGYAYGLDMKEKLINLEKIIKN
ncbi:MAG: methylated-DNA--[protein]-cysteine S-methyltransferase [Peptostreptococcaceae bacterium]|jgi:methylated-DNA-[protein]-cysteine S-methyltransferase|nr:methylated-DNA--[protein]-cysteine S-methyltransferase [Peptostreptococcaceae bacterium]